MIEVEHLTKRYGARTAVNDVSFRVGKGEVVGFLGPNGAGKSTTLRMLTGFLAPSAGAIRIDGIDMLERPAEAKAKIGYMPESSPLYPEMRVIEYLRYRAELKGVPSSRIKARVDASLQQADVTEFAHRIIGQLSKGMKQRVGIADALVADPPLLVLDEPTAGLDPNQIRQVRDLVRGLAGDKTVLLSTHILPEVEATCGRVVIIHRGKIVREGAPEELRAGAAPTRALVLRTRHDREAIEKALAGAPGVLGVHAARDGELWRVTLRVDDDPEIAETVFTRIAAAGLTLRSLTPEGQGSLEDVFSQLTTQDATVVAAASAGAAALAATAASDAEDDEDAEGDEEGDE